MDLNESLEETDDSSEESLKDLRKSQTFQCLFSKMFEISLKLIPTLAET